MGAQSLRYFLAYFKDGSCVNLQASNFEVDRRIMQKPVLSVHLHTESGEDGAAYLNSNEIAAIIPLYDGEHDGQVFKVTLKSAKTIEVRAETFVVTPVESISFRDADGRHISDVWLLTSEVLACVPTDGLPSAFKYAKSDSPSS